MATYKAKVTELNAIPFDGTPIDGITSTYNAIDNPAIPFGVTTVNTKDGIAVIAEGDIILQDIATKEILGITTPELLALDYEEQKAKAK